MKKIKVGIELIDNKIDDVDLSTPENGNPGIGGSEYLFVLLARYLQQAATDIEITCYHYGKAILPEGIHKVIVQEELEVIKRASADGMDILIHQVRKGESWYEELNKANVSAIAWAHVYPENDEMGFITRCDSVKRIVFVGKEEYDAYIDHDIIERSVFIYNMINTQREIPPRNVKAPVVTYVGSLVPAKGFHVLAEIWPWILKKMPDAQLNIIGTGKVYDRRAILGKYGIAQEDYEQCFMKYLVTEEGKIHSSVHFLGLLGEEKEKIFACTSVGVVNPTAITETFCISAIEMELCGVPVVSKRKWGLYDTIIHRKTGMLFKTKKQFKDYLLYLLENKGINEAYGENASVFVRENFEAERIIKEWIQLLYDVYKNKAVNYLGVQKNYDNDFKWVKLIIHFLRFNLCMRFIPSFETIKYKVKKIMHRI